MTLIVNTGDDLLWWGLYVSPDIDSITYVLAGLLSRERGWGVKGDTFFCLQHMGQLGQPIWFHAGDRDLAVHILRSKLLAEGVETRQQLEFLNSAGCEEAQGYYFGRPVPAEQIRKLLATGFAQMQGVAQDIPAVHLRPKGDCPQTRRRL